MQQIKQGSDYIKHVGKKCIVHTNTLPDLNGTILEYWHDKDRGHKYKIKLDKPYTNPKSKNRKDLFSVGCTKVWVDQ